VTANGVNPAVAPVQPVDAKTENKPVDVNANGTNPAVAPVQTTTPVGPGEVGYGPKTEEQHKQDEAAAAALNSNDQKNSGDQQAGTDPKIETVTNKTETPADPLARSKAEAEKRSIETKIKILEEENAKLKERVEINTPKLEANKKELADLESKVSSQSGDEKTASEKKIADLKERNQNLEEKDINGSNEKIKKTIQRSKRQKKSWS